ncbi:TPA: TraM recognition domain-containing protein [Acinetobacter baumannii]|uniref:TraM recognition domain-containing protein n=1 Tax=Acinetobacter baumannii TaxID=470 RepID=UPI0022568388|nr:TraM recognition domain-containing protein [Acinetobacter baumannii]MCX3034043.1 TraM recognition domain-containing protein [Acinetobacter baumannii]
MASFFKPRGADHNFRPYETRRDVKTLSDRLNQTLHTPDGSMYLAFGITTAAIASYSMPFSGELMLATSYLLCKNYMHPELRVHNFPWRVPIHAKLFDGSHNIEILNKLNKGNVIKHKPKALYGEGVTYYGVDRLSGLPVYSTNSDDRTHLTCLGTTGSGKTVFLLALVGNQLIQNSGLIYLDAKGDPSLQRDIVRLLRRFGREDDLLTINFITSGRDLVKAQRDKVTNTFNVMADTSSNMLIELLNNLLDDSGGGNDMWKGRAMSFISAITVCLTYLRDEGYIQLSAAAYIKYMELPALEELAFESGDKYGEGFNIVSDALKNYLKSLPGYKDSPKARKNQDQDTLKQHGFITMQLTRSLNTLTYDYGYIFGVQQGDVDIFDCVLNRRVVTIPLPALERSPASLKLLGKLCIGSVKQMMAGSLGNRIVGQVREILDSRPTNAPNAYKLIFDECGYIIVEGVSVMPAQGRSLSFSICFAAQDFSDIKRGNDNEAEALWGNSNVKIIGKLVSGKNGPTMEKVSGLTGTLEQARYTTTKLKVGEFLNSYTPSDDTTINQEEVLPFEDLSGQESGEFTILVSKKMDGGKTAGLQVIRILSFYVAGDEMKYLRLNDLCPNFSIPVDKMASETARIDAVKEVVSTNLQSITSKVAKHMQTNLIFKNIAKIQSDPLYLQNPIERIKGLLKYNIDTTFEIELGSRSRNTKQAASLGDKLVSADKAQTLKNITTNINDHVQSDNAFKTNDQLRLTKERGTINSETIKSVAIEEHLQDREVETVNIFNLIKYAEECNERLKKFNINITPTNQGLQPLPFLPTYIETATIKSQEELNDKIKNLTPFYSVKDGIDVQDSIVKEADELLSSFSNALDQINSIELNIPTMEPNKAREELSNILSLTRLARSQIGVK